MEISTKLFKFIEDLTEFNDCTKEISAPFRFTFNECMTVLTDSNLKVNDSHSFKIDVVLDYLHDELNTGHWSEIPIKTRQAFTASTFIKAVILLKLHKSAPEILKCIDLGLLLGAPLNKNPDVLVKSASLLTESINETHIPTKRKYSFTENSSGYDKLPGKEINTESCPTIETFNKKYFLTEVPAKLTNCVDHWPALKKWQDINYLLKVAGSRTVPIEIGSHYADENWGQKLMTLQDFIKNHFLSDTPADKLGYLAQHNLFDQITELRDDICIPDYCCLSKNYDDTSGPDINAWFGPQNTVSPLHYDPKNNLLVQVFGTKQIILYAPKDSACLYPHENKLLANTAQVNPLETDLDKYPLFKNAEMFKCLLKPGEMLFIPPKWWHHVTALDKSFSVSFWWE